MISLRKFLGLLVITLQTVRRSTDQASLWKTTITEVLGRFLLYFLSIHFTRLTSGSVRLREILSLARRLKRFIWKTCCIFTISLTGMATGFPFSPSPGIGEKLFVFKSPLSYCRKRINNKRWTILNYAHHTLEKEVWSITGKVKWRSTCEDSLIPVPEDRTFSEIYNSLLEILPRFPGPM